MLSTRLVQYEYLHGLVVWLETPPQNPVSFGREMLLLAMGEVQHSREELSCSCQTVTQVSDVADLVHCQISYM